MALSTQSISMASPNEKVPSTVGGLVKVFHVTPIPVVHDLSNNLFANHLHVCAHSNLNGTKKDVIYFSHFKV
jgi:hypothetical protein